MILSKPNLPGKSVTIMNMTSNKRRRTFLTSKRNIRKRSKNKVVSSTSLRIIRNVILNYSNYKINISFLRNKRRLLNLSFQKRKVRKLRRSLQSLPLIIRIYRYLIIYWNRFRKIRKKYFIRKVSYLRLRCRKSLILSKIYRILRNLMTLKSRLLSLSAKSKRSRKAKN